MLLPLPCPLSAWMTNEDVLHRSAQDLVMHCSGSHHHCSTDHCSSDLQWGGAVIKL